MKKINSIIKALENKGYKVSAKTVEKNGLEKDAILVHLNDSIAATIYTDKLEEFEGTPESIAEKIIAISTQNSPCVAINQLTEKLKDVDFLRKNLFVRLEQSPSDEYVSKKSIFPGTSEILSLRVNSLFDDGLASCKVSKSMLDSLPMTEEEAWSYAKENIEKDVVVESMYKILSSMMGIPEEILEQSSPVKMYVVTNNSKCGGASAILTETARKELRNIFGDGALIVIPSSIHECLVFKRDDDAPNEDEVLDMVATVNCNEVAPEERLSDGIFILE